MTATASRPRRCTLRGGAIDLAKRFDIGFYSEVLNATCDDIARYRRGRIGSQSQHAEVYETTNSSAILKLVPYTTHSENEAKRMLEYTSYALATGAYHLPILYKMLTCQNVTYENPELLRDAFNDLTDENASACLHHMSGHLAPDAPPRIKKELAALLSATPERPDTRKTQRLWRLAQPHLRDATGGATPLLSADRVSSIAIFAERADTDLRLLLENEPRTVAELANILYQVCAGLHILQHRGHAHNDLHAGNVLIRHLAKPTTIQYTAIQQFDCSALHRTRDYVLLWDYETVTEASPAATSVVSDIQRLLTSLQTNQHIRARQSAETVAFIDALDRRSWPTLRDLTHYLRRISFGLQCDSVKTTTPKSI